MSTIRRKAQKLARRLRRLMPDAEVRCDHSYNAWGQSSYVYVFFDYIREKIRISDHPVGEMRRLYGSETLYLTKGFKPRDLHRYIQSLLTDYRRGGGRYKQPELPLFSN